MRRRLTMVTVLTAGIVMSGAGAALASPGVRQSDNAAAAQYEETVVGVPNQPERQEILPFEERHTETSPTNQQQRQQEQPLQIGSPPVVQEVQVTRQVETGSSLPFTGFAVIPLLAIGAALLIVGLALRRKRPRES